MGEVFVAFSTVMVIQDRVAQGSKVFVPAYLSAHGAPIPLGPIFGRALCRASWALTLPQFAPLPPVLAGTGVTSPAGIFSVEEGWVPGCSALAEAEFGDADPVSPGELVCVAVTVWTVCDWAWSLESLHAAKPNANVSAAAVAVTPRAAPLRPLAGSACMSAVERRGAEEEEPGE